MITNARVTPMARSIATPCCQARQVVARRVGLLAPGQAVGEERLPVHEEGHRAGKAAPQLVEDGEAVGVDVAPVVPLASMQPPGARECFRTVARTEDDDGSRHGREGEEVGLVLGDEDALDGQRQRREAGGVTCDVGQHTASGWACTWCWRATPPASRLGGAAGGGNSV